MTMTVTVTAYVPANCRVPAGTANTKTNKAQKQPSVVFFGLRPASELHVSNVERKCSMHRPLEVENESDKTGPAAPVQTRKGLSAIAYSLHLAGVQDVDLPWYQAQCWNPCATWARTRHLLRRKRIPQDIFLNLEHLLTTNALHLIP